MMKLKELIEWAKKNDCLDCDICVQYRDDGGLYHGRDYDIYEDWFADVKFYVEGFKKVADKLGLRRVER